MEFSRIFQGQYPHHLWEDDGVGGWTYVGICRENSLGWSPTYNPTVGIFARHNSVVSAPNDKDDRGRREDTNNGQRRRNRNTHNRASSQIRQGKYAKPSVDMKI